MKKKGICILLCCLLLLSGCAAGAKEVEGQTLWVLTEQSCSDGMNLQAEIVARRMEQENPGLTVRLEVLPVESQEREIRLSQLRTKIMSGDGPDVYLLPTGNTLTTDYVNEYHRRATKETEIVPLFPDVAQAMRSGLFEDLRELYDGDGELNAKALKKEIMDAGMVENHRYVLPLRFDIPVILTDPALWERYGLSEELLESDGLGLANALLDSESSVVSGLRLPEDLRLLSAPFDYETEQLQLSTQQVADYLRVYQRWKAATIPEDQALLQSAFQETMSYLEKLWRPILEGTVRDTFLTMEAYNRLSHYICEDIHWSTRGFPLFSCSMADSLESLAVAKTYEAVYGQERELLCYPWRNADGKITANITYWGAVGSGTQNPELCYAFLRQFLEEEFQWDAYRPREKENGKTRTYEVQCAGQVENSWPVRTVGSSALWETLRYQNRKMAYSGRKESNQVGAAARSLTFADEDIPALSWKIDEVRFPVTLSGEDSIESALRQLNEEDGTPKETDIDKLAEQVCQGLWWHLAEG